MNVTKSGSHGCSHQKWYLTHLFSILDRDETVEADARLKVFHMAYVGLQTSLLVLYVAAGAPKTRLSITCASLAIVAYSILLLVSYLEHTRSVRPSTLLCTFLGGSILLDLARARTLFLIPGGRTIANVFLASYVIKVVMLCLEAAEKRNLVRPRWKEASVEAAGGVFNRTLFIWLNGVFIRGFRTLLTVDTLGSLDNQILSASEPHTLIERWKIGSCVLCQLFMTLSANFYFSSKQVKPGCTAVDFLCALQE